MDTQSGRRIGIVSFQWMFDLLKDQSIASGITPDRLSINLFSEVVMATLSGARNFGYHFSTDLSAATGVPGSTTYMEAAYFGTGSFLGDKEAGTYILGHELAEWIADPSVSNVVPGWQIPTRPAQCFSPIREIADPLEDLPVFLQVPSRGRLYNLPDVVFDAYFRRDPRSHAVNRQLTLLDTFQDTSIPCSYDELGTFPWWFIDPSTGDPLPATILTSVNNAKGASGYYTVDGLTFGFALAGYDPVTGTLGTPSFVGVPVPDLPGYVYDFTMPTGISTDGTVVGYYWDGAQLHGFVDSNGQYTTIDVPGAVSTQILGTNSRSNPDLVGEYTDASGRNRGFVLSGGRFTTIDAPFGVNTSVNGINDLRQIVGSYDSGADLAGFEASLPRGGNDDRPGGFVSVTWPAPQPDAAYSLQLTGVNVHGEMVGVVVVSNVYGSLTYPFELVNGVFQLLNFGLDADQGKVGIANAVNDDGIIAGGMVVPQGVLTETWVPYGLVLAAGASAAPALAQPAFAGWRPTLVR